MEHPPVAPAFALRFDTAEGSVAISGDTVPCENPVTIARGTDLLLDEAIDFKWVSRAYGNVATEEAQASMDHYRRSHTSGQDAIALAENAGAAQLALHHLVPGTTPKSVWVSKAGEFSGTFLVPNDLDEIPLSTATRNDAASAPRGCSPARTQRRGWAYRERRRRSPLVGCARALEVGLEASSGRVRGSLAGSGRGTGVG